MGVSESVSESVYFMGVSKVHGCLGIGLLLQFMGVSESSESVMSRNRSISWVSRTVYFMGVSKVQRFMGVSKVQRFMGVSKVQRLLYIPSRRGRIDHGQAELP